MQKQCFPALPLIIIFFLTSLLPVFAADKEIDYNEYYRYPVSFGLEYQNLSPLADYRMQFDVYDLGLSVRVPLPFAPFFQPVARAGMVSYSSTGIEVTDSVFSNPAEWEHIQWYGMAGMGFGYRFDRNVEMSAEILGGFSEGVFAALVQNQQGLLGAPNLIAEAGARLSINPVFNFNIDIHPSIRYLYPLSVLDQFSGFVFGIGLSAHFRLGQDPDASGVLIRSIRFEDIKIPALFAAMQSYYTKNPIGKAVITNTEKHTITDITVSFFQAGYMDSPTLVKSIPSLKAGETQEIDIFASFNSAVFSTEGVTPLTGEVIVAYTSRSRAAEQRQPVSYDLYDKTAMVWDDDKRVAAFITPADTALRNYTSYIRQVNKGEEMSGFNAPLQTAMQIFDALKVIGLIYQADPSSPFTRVQSDLQYIDSVSLPRDTLKRITGDCDDLTVLFNSLLETVGIETGFITVPGHIYSAFNTKVPSTDYLSLHPDRKMTIAVDGELWVPVEITMINGSDFLSAWQQGISEWTLYDADPAKRIFNTTRKAQEIFRPVGLKESDLGLQYGSERLLAAQFKSDLEKVTTLLEAYLEKLANESKRKQDYNKLGIVFSRFGKYARARQAFANVLKLDRDDFSARINLGNVLYMEGDYKKAIREFESIVPDLKARGRNAYLARIYLNISKSWYRLEQKENADKYYAMARELEPELVSGYEYLSSVSAEKARASSREQKGDEIIYITED